MLFGVLILGVIFYVLMTRGHFGHHYHGSCHGGHRYGHEADALEILRMRYAKGEITSEEFAQMSKNLTNS